MDQSLKVAHAKVIIMDRHSSESRTKFFEFGSYDDLNKLVNEFEEETGFIRPLVEIEDVDGSLDESSINLIIDGCWR